MYNIRFNSTDGCLNVQIQNSTPIQRLCLCAMMFIFICNVSESSVGGCASKGDAYITGTIHPLNNTYLAAARLHSREEE